MASATASSVGLLLAGAAFGLGVALGRPQVGLAAALVAFFGVKTLESMWATVGG